ncbi:MAG: hypothetical protein WC069_06695 [Candidatus Shapirobacteria bacterium]
MRRLIDIQKSIAEIQNVFPSNNLISCYADFLKHREYLHFYQFNETVFNSLIDLTLNLWDTTERINRASLVEVTKRYAKKGETKDTVTPQTATKIFELFKQIVYYKNLKLSNVTVDKIMASINSILIGVKLKEVELQWLCDHSTNSGFLLNRLLRYHLKSKAISEWAKKNFEKDFARSRRSEITSWIIDENPDFKIDKETIEYDFEYQIIEDKRIVNAYKNEVDAYRAIEKELRPILTSVDNSFIDDDGFKHRLNFQEKPVLKRPRRHYPGYIKMNSGYGIDIPDFDKINEDFNDKFDYYYNRIMAWSFAYSRLPINIKTSLLHKYYTDELFPTFFTIGKKLKSVEYFNWLKQLAC